MSSPLLHFFPPHFYCLRIQPSLLTRSSTRRLRRLGRNVPCAKKRGKTAACVMAIVYGDDIVIYFTNLCTSEIARAEQDDLNQVIQWIESSRLILNQSKTKSMLFGSWQNLTWGPWDQAQFSGSHTFSLTATAKIGLSFRFAMPAGM